MQVEGIRYSDEPEVILVAKPPPAPVDDRPVWIRERTGPRRVAPSPQRRATYRITLPLSYCKRVAMEEAIRAGVAMTTPRDLVKDRADRPVPDEMAVMPQDERYAKYGKPVLYVSQPEGKNPIIIVGGGAYHWQELAERVAEKRHYGTDQPPAGADRRPVDWKQQWGEEAERRQDRRKGRFQSGPGRRGVLDAQARPNWDGRYRT